MSVVVPWKVITIAVCITIVLVAALLKGVNGALLASGLSALAGLGGFTLGTLRKK